MLSILKSGKGLELSLSPHLPPPLGIPAGQSFYPCVLLWNPETQGRIWAGGRVGSWIPGLFLLL